MATQNVKFYFGTQAKYDALVEKNNMALYFIEDTQRLYKGSMLIASGATATSMASGLMSAEDKIKLDELVAGGGLSNLAPVDGTIVIADKEGGGKSIGVAISTQDDNALIVVNDGLFVPTVKPVSVPEYTIEKQEVAEDGFATSYKLKKTVDGEITYVGDTINIAKDMVLQNAILAIVIEANVPYDGAVIGDPYIDMAFNDAAQSHIYIPVKGLVDAYTAGNGIEIVDGNVSVKVADDSHGLVAVNGAMTMLLATEEQDGAMSKEDKAFINSIPYVYEARKYDISGVPDGTLVNYGEKEIRIMCPANAEFTKQAVGAGGDGNTYYMAFKTYAPNDSVVGYIEHIGSQFDAEILTNLSVDKYGRRYQTTWLGLAKLNEETGIWTYHGKNSTIDKFVGWDYQIDWYDTNNVLIATDSIRINLSNEDCHNYIRPYYGADNDLSTEIVELQEALAEMQEMYSWGEM
jgi:hypothetical protein